MKNKIFKLGLFSLLSLGALASVSATLLTNKINAKGVSFNAEQKITTSAPTSNREWPTTGGNVVLDQDETIDRWTLESGETTLDLNGHVLTLSEDHGITIEGNGTILNIIDSNPNTEHKYYVDDTNHRWVIDSVKGDKIVKGGVIFSQNNKIALYSAYYEDGNKRCVNMEKGTICGASSGIYFYNDYYHGGDIYSEITLKNVNVCGNSGNDGAGIYVGGNTSLNIDGGVFSENYSNGNGGAICFSNPNNWTSREAIIKNAKISDNYAGGNGGGVYINNAANFATDNCLITHNISNAYGGGLCANGINSSETPKFIKFISGEISYNTAKYGGGVYSSYQYNRFEVPDGQELKIVNNTATNSINGGSAGGMYLYWKDKMEGLSYLSGKITIKDNITTSPGDCSNNLFVYRGKLEITGHITGSVIYFSNIFVMQEYGAIVERYDLSGAVLDNFATEFFRYEGQDNTYVYLTGSGENRSLCYVRSETVLSKAIPMVDSTEGDVLPSFDRAPENTEVHVLVTPTEHHTLTSLVYVDSEGLHNITDSKVFIMPSEDVIIIATFNHPDVVKVPGKAPTCFENGWKDYYVCPGCNRCYEDELANIEIPDIEIWKITTGKIEKLKHAIKLVKGKTPTCTEDGWKDYYRCSVCGDLFADEAGISPITNFEEWKINEGKLPKIPHALKLIKGKAPTLVDAGYKDYYRCLECREYFEDKDGTIKILDLEEWKVTRGALGPTLGANNLMIILVVAVAAIITPIVIVVSINEIKKKRYLRVNNNYLFSDIKYSRTTHPTAPSLDEHTFDFIYQGEHIYYYIFTRKVDKVSDKEVKAKFQEILKSGKLRKYSSHYYKKIY